MFHKLINRYREAMGLTPPSDTPIADKLAREMGITLPLSDNANKTLALHRLWYKEDADGIVLTCRTCGLVGQYDSETALTLAVIEHSKVALDA